MSNYQLLPISSNGLGSEPFCTWNGGFSDEDCDRIIAYGETLEKNKAIIGGYKPDDEYGEYRESTTSWIRLTPETDWIYDRLGYILRKLNSQFYRFDLYGFHEDFQYTTYSGDVKGHYTWHMDQNNDYGTDLPPRKLSMILQLTDPNQYEGGDIQFMVRPEPITIEKVRGQVIVFPAYIMHRVTPVTKGVRNSLVAWSCGPSFR